MKNTLLGAIALSAIVQSALAQWNPATPVASPTARAAAAIDIDFASGNLVMFGGDTGGFSPSNQTWSYNGTTWTQLTPVASATGRAGHEMAYDPIAGVFWMYGGLNSSPFGGACKNDTWQFDGTTWTQVFPTTSPGGRGLFGMCYDTVRNKVVLHGGAVNPGILIYSNETWEFNGTNWSLMTTANNPGPLERPAMCFHQGIGKTVLFGGIDVQVGGTDKTWTYDGTNWTELVIGGSKPAPRSGARMTYDSVRGVCVLTGGVDPTGATYFTDTWEFSGSSWTQIASTIPSNRISAMQAFMPARKMTVCFGGVDFNTFTYKSDTLEYGAKSGTFGTGCAGTNGTPALSAVDAPRLGQNYTLNVTNLETTFNLAIMVFGFTQIPGGVDLGPVLGMPGCFAYESADLLLTATSGAAGTASWNWTPVAGTVGDTFYAQALCLDPTVNAFGWTLSNAISAVVGY